MTPPCDKLLLGHNPPAAFLRHGDALCPKSPSKPASFSLTPARTAISPAASPKRSKRAATPDSDRSLSDPANVATGISAEDEWWQRLQDMIAAADVMVFVVSPDSAASKVCDEEIAYARGIGKRHHPDPGRRAIDFAKAPPRLSALNVKIDFTGDSDEAFAAALDQLCAALDLDVAWHRENRRLTELALKWDAAGRPADSLMRPADIKAAERLLERRPEAPSRRPRSWAITSMQAAPASKKRRGGCAAPSAARL